MFAKFLMVFVPLFVAVDVIGVLPIFMSFTQGLSAVQRRKIVAQSLVTALSLALGFIFLGKWTFRLLGITVSDFMIAGGAILFCIAVIDLLRPGKQRRMPVSELGVVPIGTPLIVGPAVLTTLLMLMDQYGLWLAIAGVTANLLIVGVVFIAAERIIRVLGKTGAMALSKIMALFLAAIAVMMIRKGLFALISHH